MGRVVEKKEHVMKWIGAIGLSLIYVATIIFMFRFSIFLGVLTIGFTMVTLYILKECELI